MKRSASAALFSVLCSGIIVLFAGCVGTNYIYSPKEHMVMAQSHNDFLEIGPCGVPWNYDDQVNILLPSQSVRGDRSQLEIYQNGKLNIESGYVILDRTNRTVRIHLMLEGCSNGVEHVGVPCKYNGIHKYVERDPQPGEVTRKWLQDFFRTNAVGMYVP